MIPSGSINLRSRRVLLIENSAGDRKLLRSWLNSEAIDTFEAVDIMTGLAACQKYLPNLILLQLRLNTWDGFEVIKRLKDDPRTRSIPVIFLANSALTAEKAKGIDMGAVDFVSQPYDSVELLARVHSALRTKALLDLLEQRAHLDGLTELGNRFALQQMIPQEIETCLEANAPLSILIADLDHFKKVNDHYGHAAGDEVLRRFAVILRHATRETDFLARYGGEEFVVLCPNCNMETALETAERIRAGVSDHPVSFRNSAIRVTASIGLLSTRNLDGEDSRILLDRADQALYRAKSGGRNAVWLWDEATGSPTPAIPSPDAEPDGVAKLIAANAKPAMVEIHREVPVEIPSSFSETWLATSQASSNSTDESKWRENVEPDEIDPSLSRDRTEVGAPKLGAARRETHSLKPDPKLVPGLESSRFEALAPPPPPSASETSPRPAPRTRPNVAAAVPNGSGPVSVFDPTSSSDVARRSASSSEIEALWGVGNILSASEPPAPKAPPPPVSSRISQGLFGPRVELATQTKPAPPPRRVGNGPPPPPPNPRRTSETPATVSPPKSD